MEINLVFILDENGYEIDNRVIYMGGAAYSVRASKPLRYVCIKTDEENKLDLD